MKNEPTQVHGDGTQSRCFGHACAAVVDLVRVEGDDLSGHGGPRRAPVVEHLDAQVGQTDRVRIVTMLLIRGAGEPGGQQLHAVGGPGAGDPARGRALARSFKTLAARSGLLGSHRR